MNVNKLTLKKIFDTTERFEAPMFQRHYVWTEENWEPLLESVISLAELILTGQKPRPHFLGTIVLDQLKTSVGEVSARQIIDGQQRLTTLQLLFAALRDICLLNKREDYRKVFRKLTENDVPLSRNHDDVFKVWPTNADQDDFRNTMRANSFQAVKKLPHSDPEDGWLIPDCYLFFYKQIGDWLKDETEPCPEERMSALYQALIENVHIVGIDLDGQDDPQEIFETLNALGTPLLPADLVKNFLFRSAVEKKLDTHDLYSRYWKSFDTERDYWRQKSRQGRLRRPRVDLFLFHYLTLKCGEVPFDSQLFATFKGFYSRNHEQDPAKHMDEFKAYAEIYKSFDRFPADSREGNFFHRLELMDTMTVYPLLLEIFRTHPDASDRPDLNTMLADLESFLVRRFVCGLTSKNYNKFFAQMAGELKRRGGFTGTVLREYLSEQTAETSRWPDNEEFRASWAELHFYTHLSQTKTRMILEAIERWLISGKTENIILDDTLTIEHLLPRKWEEHWPLVFDPNVPGDEEIARGRRNRCLHKIGNLTLLTGKLNPAISNSTWSEKKKEIKEHSILVLNRHLPEIEIWNEDEIDKRTKELFVHALQLWPRPGQVPSAAKMNMSSTELEGYDDEKDLSGYRQEYLEFFRDIKLKLETAISKSLPEPKPRSYYQIPVGKGAMHLEWAFHGRPRRSFGVELHFERGKRDANEMYLGFFERYIPQIEQATGEQVLLQKDWGRVWSRLYIQKEEGCMTEELKTWAVERMAALYLLLKPEFNRIERS